MVEIVEANGDEIRGARHPSPYPQARIEFWKPQQVQFCELAKNGRAQVLAREIRNVGGQVANRVVRRQDRGPLLSWGAYPAESRHELSNLFDIDQFAGEFRGQRDSHAWV